MLRGYLLLLSLVLTVSSFAGQDPNVRRGIAPGNAYRAFDIDTINQFNGNLVLRIPLSDAPVGPLLSQVLQLTYNSSVYDYQFVMHRNYPEDSLYKRRAIPEVFSNSGLGWSLSLGRLVAPRAGTVVTPDRGWHYRSPSGSEHDFTLGLGDVAEATTHDGSFLRLKRYPSDTTQAATHREIEMPDGTVHRFNPDGYLTEIRDRVDHTIEIDYSDSMKWVIRNKYDGTTFRTTTVHFENRTAPSGYTYPPNFQKVVSSIDVPAFNGTTATYELTYEDTVLLRDGCGDEINYDPQYFAAPLLTGIELPEGLTYTLTYQPNSAAECSSGLIGTVKLPSLGSIGWTYQTYQLSQKDCDDEHGWVVEVPGVHKRVLKDAADTAIGTWTYATDIDLNPGTNTACGAFDGINWPYGPAPTEITTTVTTALGSAGSAVGGKTIHYFSGTLHQFRANALGYKVEEYGLPFTRRVPDSTNATRFLSTERFDGANALIRSSYLTYKGDATNYDGRLANARVQGELTVFNGDTGCGGVACRIDTDRPETDYDQYGHYRKSVTTSNFGPTRTTFTNYTPDTDPWILGTYDSSWVEEGGAARKQLFTFDDNGILRTRRTLVGAGATAAAISPHATKDLLQVYCRDTRGFLSSERFFGGDGASALIPTGDPCIATPAATEYQIDHVFTFNANKAPIKHTAKYTGMPFFIADEDLDVNTGLVSTSRDVSGISTSFNYDGLRRLKDVKPTGAFWTLYEYSNPSGSTVPASLRVTTRAYGTASTVTPLTDAYVYYDWMGRPIQEKAKTPSDSGDKWATTNTGYDLFSRRTNVSVPEFRDSASYESTFAPAKSTVMSFDVLGRPTSVVGPDNKTRSITYTGSGVRKISKTAQAALTTGATDVTTAATYDAYGHLLEIEEPTGTKTRYSYGLTGHLSKVCQDTADAGATCGQSRTFTRDNRALLTSETHVENGTVDYSYDARGNALSKSISGDAQSEGNLKFVYDAAERLTAIQTHHPTLSSYRSGKVFTFGAANTGTGGANKTLGKLTSATRYNYNVGELTVKETYDYVDSAGRLSKTTTEIKKDGTTLQTLEQSQTYESGGSLKTITYPTCITVSCGAATWNTSTFEYTNGFLTDIDRFVDSISYTAAGAVSKVDHTGPVTDTYTADDTAVRPKSITFQGHSICSAPVITTGSPANQSVTTGQSATFTVSATGATGYQWYESDGTKITGQTGSSYTTPALTSAKSYYVEAYNDCKTVRSHTATVNVCPQLSITPSTPQNQSIAPEETATLTVSATGATAYQWYEGNGTPISGQTSASFTTPSLTSTKTYYVEASNDCGTLPSRTATVTVRSLPPPAGLVATASGTSTASISWNASTDADHYVLERKSNGSAFIAIQSVYGTSVTDSGLVANRTYVYRVRAVSPNELVSSAPSNADLATTMLFTPLVAGQTLIAAAHFEELLSAVNAVRAANGTVAASWGSILPAGVPAPAPGVIVQGQHILSLRSAMNAARTALGLGGLTYTDPILSGVLIRVVHPTEIRGGVE